MTTSAELTVINMFLSELTDYKRFNNTFRWSRIELLSIVLHTAYNWPYSQIARICDFMEVPELIY